MKIKNNLKKLSKEDYILVIDDFIQTFSKYPFVSLYKFGSIKHPSISDLDLVIVYDSSINKEKIKELAIKANKFIKKNEKNRYIFTHGILIYPKDVFKDIKYIHTLYDYTCIHGKELELKEIPKEEKQVLKDILFINFTFSSYLSFRKITNMEDVKLRELLLSLNSIKYSFSYLFEKYKKNEIYEFLEILNKVRDNTSLVNSIDLKKLENTLKKYLNLFSREFLKNKVFYEKFEKISNRDIKLFVVQEKKLIKIPGSLILHGASYHYLCNTHNLKYCYIHKLLYPIHKISIIDPIYRKIILKQLKLMKDLEKNYINFGIEPLVPFMCKYCVPYLSQKQKIKLTLNKLLLKLQI